MAVDVGMPAPDVTLISTDLEPKRISDFRGKPVVLAFFPGAFTSVCTKEMCTFRDSMARFNQVNAQVLGISVDSPFSQKAFAEANNLNFPLLSDFNKEAIKAYGVVLSDLRGLRELAQRAVFVLDRDGVVRYKWVAEVPSQEPPYEEVERAVKALR